MRSKVVGGSDRQLGIYNFSFMDDHLEYVGPLIPLSLHRDSIRV